MSTGTQKYRKLPASARDSFGSWQLWHNDTELLLVRCSFVDEKYSRFFFNDIEAIVTVGNRSRLWWAVGLAPIVLLLVLVLVNSLQTNDPGENAGFGILLAAFLAGLLTNTLGSQRCKTFVRVSGQWHPLPAVRTVYKAQRVMKKIEPLITLAQTAATSDGGSAPASAAASAGTGRTDDYLRGSETESSYVKS